MKKSFGLALFFILFFLFVFGAGISATNFFKEKHFDALLRQLPLTGELMVRFKLVNQTSDIQALNDGLWWDDNDGYSVIIPSTESILIAKTKDGEILESTVIPGEYFMLELAIAKQVFTNRGFTLNKRNSSTSIDDSNFYDYVQAYEKNGKLCTIVVNEDYSSYGSGIGKEAKMAYTLMVSCGDTLSEAQIEQHPFLDALGLKDKKTVVQIINQDGLFFQIGMNQRRGGFTAILKKDGNKYRVLLISQEAPSCALIDKEKIPSNVLSSIGEGSCFTNTGERRE